MIFEKGSQNNKEWSLLESNRFHGNEGKARMKKVFLC